MKRYIRRNVERHDNRGFSLVELLVAVIVFAIVASPLLHVMVTGAKTASRSGKMGDATIALQNISETIEANDLQSLVAKDENTLYGGAVKESNFISGINGYELVVSDIKAGASSFNAKILFNPQENAGVENAIHKINSQQMANYTNMDAVFAMSQGEGTDPDSLAMNMLGVELSKHISPTLKSTDRKITLDVYNSGEKIFADLKFEYKFTYNELGKTEDLDYSLPEPERYSLFPQGFKADTGSVPGIYIMYNPIYDGSDEITINNKDNLAFKLFLVKQKTADSSKDPNYQAYISIHNNTDQDDRGNAQVYSNAKENLNGGAAEIPTVIYKIFYNEYQFAPNPEFDGDKQGDLVSKDAKSRLFEVTIKLYSEDDTECKGTPISEFSTSKLQ